MKEWVEIIRVCLGEPVKGDHRAPTGSPRENLKRWVRCPSGAVYAAHNNDASIGDNKCG